MQINKIIRRFCIPWISFVIIISSSFQALAQNEKTPLKVMTYNIWNGFDWGKDTARHELFIPWIKTQNPDVLALQELCGYTEEKLQSDAKRWGHNYVAILKTDGYPVGITSRSPIEVKERVLDSLWHGMMHVATFGIDFYVVHLSPADALFRWREAKIITAKIRKDPSEKVIVLGDFNSHSPFDIDPLHHNQSLLDKYRRGDAKSDYSNLRNGTFDFSVIAMFLATPLIDVCPYFVEPDKRYSFPTPVLVGTYQTMEEVNVNKERIDYILVSPSLEPHCRNITILNEGQPRLLSDHFPVMAIFDF